MDQVHCSAKHNLDIRPATEPSATTVSIPGNQWDYPRDLTVASLFEEVAARYPENIAVIFGNSQLTYSELNARANRLAHRMLRAGVGSGSLVGCCLERSQELIIALLAILKTGAAYVPLDPAYPRDRVALLLNDTQVPVILSQRSLAAILPRSQNLTLLIVDDPDSDSSANDDANPEPAGAATGVAYVMYTSGSTGVPKGVMVTNRAIIRLVRNTNYCHFGPDEVFLQLAPVSFDASTFEIWGALLNGGCLAVMPPRLPSLEDIGRAIRSYRVTTLWLTSGLFHLMVDQRLDDLKPLRHLLAGGDVLSPAHVRLCLENLPNTVLINGYGPTENTTFTCCHVMRPGDSVPDSIPIGRPISHTRVCILDSNMHPVASGQSGEIYISGDGLALGYLNRPEETAQRFLPNPFCPHPADDDPQARLYRTGDLGRWRPDGAIEFLGRIDNQIKILGHRVELEEIEAVFRGYHAVRQICVVPKQTDNLSKTLIAFYVASRKAVSASALRQFGAQKLPGYMVPSQFFPLDSLPLSPNGKVDRKALAASQVGQTKNESPTPKLATHLEATLRELWQRVLQTPQVGLQDNFFDLGGDSLLLMTLHSQLEKALATRVSLTDLFRFPTVRSLARHLENQETPIVPAPAPVESQAVKQREAFARWQTRQASEIT
jgi:amino acid adenylation domain-containing protein